MDTLDFIMAVEEGSMDMDTFVENVQDFVNSGIGNLYKDHGNAWFINGLNLDIVMSILSNRKCFSGVRST
jgi:hypothetical protein